MRAAVVNTPESAPVCTEFPDPEQRPGRRPLLLVGAGLHHVVRGLASGHHYRSERAYPLIPGIDAVARTDDGLLVYTGLAESPCMSGSLAVRAALSLGAKRVIAAGRDHEALERLRGVGAVTVVYPLSRVGEAWAHQGRARAVVVPD